jgi:hypothetical protein
MPESLATRIPIKSGHLERVKKWAQDRHARAEETRSALRERSVHANVLIIETTEQGHFLIWYTNADDPSRASVDMLLSEAAIDQEAKKVLEGSLLVEEARTLDVVTAVFL